ncbi:hypothetical protein RIF29_21247 [Crotalaria pallida]|uniref:Pectinesterase inhibitor domain-containing protein n=1 Tax=Crotalaria pallida TaxID=3830 RepID=A0AAN9F699_CROPI
MSPSAFPLILFTLCLIFISHAPLPTSAIKFKLYQIVCVENSIYDFISVAKCLKALEVNPRIPLAKTYAELSELIIELALKNSTGVQDYLKILMKTNPSPAIKQCAVEDYTKIIQNYTRALTLVASDPQKPHYVFPLPYHLLTCDLRLASPFFSPAKSLLRSSLRRNRSSHPAKSLIVLLTRVFSENQNAFSASTELADTVNDNYWFVYD